MKIDLPYPHKILWPNGRTRNPRYKATEVKKHKGWAWAAAMSKNPPIVTDGAIPIHITVLPKAKGPLPDKDNVVASCKSYIDGIAQALGVNDQMFDAPTVGFSDSRTGRFQIEVDL